MYGNIGVLDTLKNTTQTVVDFGEENAFEVIESVLEAHNRVMQDALSSLVEFTQERLFNFGTSASMEMRRVDEWGSVDTQKVNAGQNLALPLYNHQIAVGWTKKAMQVMPARRLAAQFASAADADIRNIHREVRIALFTPTNNLNYRDRLIDNVELQLRALLNGDGQEAPPSPTGETFAGSHTHYTASTALDATTLEDLIENVREHNSDGDGELVVFISRADESTVRALTEFKPYVDGRMVMGANAEYAAGDLDRVRIHNRAIGIFGSAEVWVKPWVPADYQVALYLDAEKKPLGLRTRSGEGFTAGMGSLSIAAEHDHFPLRAQFMEREFGVGVINRDRAAVHFSGAADTTYVAPTIT